MAFLRGRPGRRKQVCLAPIARGNTRRSKPDGSAPTSPSSLAIAMVGVSTKANARRSAPGASGPPARCAPPLIRMSERDPAVKTTPTGTSATTARTRRLRARCAVGTPAQRHPVPFPGYPCHRRSGLLAPRRCSVWRCETGRALLRPARGPCSRRQSADTAPMRGPDAPLAMPTRHCWVVQQWIDDLFDLAVNDPH
jgi:hypothetical protein